MFKDSSIYLQPEGMYWFGGSALGRGSVDLPAIIEIIYEFSSPKLGGEKETLDVDYDSYFFWDTLSIYPEEIKSFIDNNGFIACGVVPTTDIIRGVDLDGLKEQFERGLTSLEKIGIPSERLRNQVLITPSCGTGSLVVEDALKVFSLLKGLRNSYVEG